MSSAVCPDCSSSDLSFFAKRNRYNCNECGYSFEATEVVKKSLRIFLSYGRDEYAAMAERLKADLESRGHVVWFDKERLKEGGDWEAYIEDGLNFVSKDPEVGRVVFLMTPHSVRRPDGYCLNEIAKALDRSLPIVPIMLAWCEPPLSIYRLQYLDMQDSYPPDEKGGTYERSLDRLVLALEEKKLDFEGIQSRLLRVLEPISFAADLSRLLNDFTGRDWVFAEVDRWLSDPGGSRIFWISGPPGVGKSSISAWIRDNRREVAAFHFCDIHSEEKRSPSKLVRSIAYQLSTQLPEYQERLNGLNLEQIIEEYSEAYTLFDKLVVQPLAANYPEPDRNIVVLIDALDEATSGSRNEIALFLSRCASNTPPWLRFLVTSRPEPEITTLFQALSPYVLETTKEENLADIRSYLTKRLSGMTEEQQTQIVERSEGVFLYVRYVCDEVDAGRLSLDHLEEFPRGLGDVYYQFFDRKFGSDPQFYADRVRPLLSLVMAAFEPLSLSLLQEILGLESKMELFDRLDRLGALFPRSGSDESDTVQPFHRSLADWLTSKDSAGSYFVDVEYGHKLIIDYGWQQYKKDVSRLDNYTLQWLPNHCTSLAQYDQTVQLLKNFNYMMVRAERGQVEGLLRVYRELWLNLPLECQEQLRVEEDFFRTKGHFLRRGDERWPAHRIMLQLAVEHADDSPLTHGAERWLEEDKCDWYWLRKEKRSPNYQKSPLVNVLEGHDEAIYDVKILKDGNILSWGADKSLHVWNGDGLLLRKVSGFEGTPELPFIVNSPYMPGNRPISSVGTIIAFSDDKELCLWSHTGQKLSALTFNNEKAEGARFFPDGRVLTWGSDTSLSIWSDSGKYLGSFCEHDKKVDGVIFLPDGRILTGTEDDKLHLWDNDGRYLKPFFSEVEDLTVLDDGKSIVSTEDKKTALVDESGELISVLSERDSNYVGGYILGDGNILFCEDGFVELFNSKGESIRTIIKNKKKFDGLIVVSSDLFLTWSHNSMWLWNVDGQLLQEYVGHSGRIVWVEVLEENRILSWSIDGIIRFWSIEGNYLSCKDDSSLQPLPYVDELIIHSTDGAKFERVLLDGALNEAVDSYEGKLYSFQILIDGRILACADDNNIRLWDQAGKQPVVLQGHEGHVFGCEVLRDGKILSFSEDRTMRFWSKNGVHLKTIASPVDTTVVNGEFTFCAAIELSDGRILSWLDEKVLRLWTSDGEPLGLLSGHENKILNAKELRDGKILSTAYDGEIRLWNSDGDGLAVVLHEHHYGILGVEALSSSRFLTWAADCTLRIWDADQNALQIIWDGTVYEKVWDGNFPWIDSVCLLNDGKFMAFSRDGFVNVFNIEGEMLGRTSLSQFLNGESDLLLDGEAIEKIYYEWGGVLNKDWGVIFTETPKAITASQVSTLGNMIRWFGCDAENLVNLRLSGEVLTQFNGKLRLFKGKQPSSFQ